ILKRVSPNFKELDGPVLYQILFRSNATPGHIPRIAPNFTLTNSLISDNGTQVAIGGLSIASNGVITFAGGQAFPGSVNRVTAGNGFITIGGTVSDPSVGLSPSAPD